MTDSDRVFENVAATNAATTNTGIHPPNQDDAYFGPYDAGNTTAAPAGAPLQNPAPATPTTERPPPLFPAEDPRRVHPLDRQQSAIRLRRLRGPTLPSRLAPIPSDVEHEQYGGGRRRSSSEPHRPTFPTETAWTAMPPVAEDPSQHSRGIVPAVAASPAHAAIPQGAPIQEHRHFPGRRRLTLQGQPLAQVPDGECYDSRIVDFLDVIGGFPLLSIQRLIIS